MGKEKKKIKMLPAGTDRNYINYEDPDSLEKVGNGDAKILAKAFEELSKDGMSLEDRKKIEKFDDILQNADIVINKSGTMATIAQEDGHTFQIKTSVKAKVSGGYSFKK